MNATLTALKERAAAAGRVLRDDAVRLGREIRAIRFRRPGKVAARWLASSFAVLTIALVLFFAFFEWNWLRGPIGRYASNKLEREVRINGDLDVKLFTRTPRVTADWRGETQPAVQTGDRVGGPLNRRTPINAHF